MSLHALDATSPLIPPGPPAIPSTAMGHVQLLVGIAHPPGPCRAASTPIVLSTQSPVAVCGMIKNPGMEAFTGGQIVRLVPGGAPTIVAFIGGAQAFHPPSPCDTYRLVGTIALSTTLLDEILANRGGFGVTFSTVAAPGGAIGGLFPPGPPSTPETDVNADAGLLDGAAALGTSAAADACTIDVTPLANT